MSKKASNPPPPSSNILKSNFEFNLGSEVQCIITKFKGIVRSRSEYLTGCNVYGIQPLKLKDGQPEKWLYLDEPQLKLVQDKKINLEIKSKPGGPKSKNHRTPEKS